MAFSYERLWKLLIEKKMTKEEFRKSTKISPSTIAAMGKGRGISPKVLDRICTAFLCQPSDIMEHIPNEEPIEIKKDKTIASKTTEMPKQPPKTEKLNSPKKENIYRIFTKAEEDKIDLKKLVDNKKYQLDIGLTFGVDVLAQLLEKAKNEDLGP